MKLLWRMPMFTIKKHNLIGIEKWNYYILLTIGIIVISYGIINKAPIGYLTFDVFDASDIGNSYFYDYIAPLFLSVTFILAIMSYNQKNIIESLFFLSNRKIFPTIVYLSVVYTGLSSLFIGVGAYSFYINVGDFTEVFSLAISFVPNILFINSLILCINAGLKNPFECIILLSVYFFLDYSTDARIFKLFSLGVHTYKTIWSENRLFLSVVSIILFYLGTRAKLWLYTEKIRSD